MIFKFFIAIFLGIFLEANVLVDKRDNVPFRGVYEISFKINEEFNNGFEIPLKLEFLSPSGKKTIVDGFYDGKNIFKARAYANEIGLWFWSSLSKNKSLDKKIGSFTVKNSNLKGKLKIHKNDSYHFAYENDEWFLHIGDTAYRYVNIDEPYWEEYLEQAVKMGATKIRTWFNTSRFGVEGLWEKDDRSRFNLKRWKEIDKRLSYALNKYPHIIFQLIPFGEDNHELLKYHQGNKSSFKMAEYSQARFSSFPNIIWCVSNDRYVNEQLPNTKEEENKIKYAVEKIAQDMYKREPWETLLTNHQARFRGYSFIDSKWSDTVTLEDVDQVDGKLILAYYNRKPNTPIVLDEDRYETHRGPKNDRYYFRRLMWASLFSGGSATYGGVKSWEVYNPNYEKHAKNRSLIGVHPYYELVKDGVLEKGAHDFNRIHEFFESFNIDLVGMKPNDKIVGSSPYKYKGISNDELILVYLANPIGDEPGTDMESKKLDSVKVLLPQGKWSIQWFDPMENGFGTINEETINGGKEVLLTSPNIGDWILVLKKVK